MPRKVAPDNVRDEAVEILKIFKATPDLKVVVGKRGEEETFGHAEMLALDEAVAEADGKVEAKRAELTPLINDRDDKALKLNAVLVQARKGIASRFGNDSDEYELAGGTRASERKAPVRRAAAKLKSAA